MKFLIFGGSGFVGNSIAEYISSMGGEVLCASRSGVNNSLKLDITNEADFERISAQPDVIIHCASQIPEIQRSFKDMDFLKELFLTNVIGAVNVANWAVRQNIPKIINCSTLVVNKKPWPIPLTEEYSQIPDGIHVGYSMSKLTQEQLMTQAVADSNTTLLHLRLSAVYGNNMPPAGIIFSLLDKLIQNENIQLFDANKNTFDFINVKDVSRYIFNLSQNKFESGIVNLASGKPISLSELAIIMKEQLGSSSLVNNTDTEREPSHSSISIAKLTSLVGDSSFIDIKEGLRGITIKYKA